MTTFLVLLTLALAGFVGYAMVRFTRIPGYARALAGVALMLLPVAAGLAAGYVGTALGCTVNEAGASPCLVGGVDIGGTLGTFAVLPWLGFFTLPAAAVLGLVALVLFISSRRTQPPPL